MLLIRLRVETNSKSPLNEKWEKFLISVSPIYLPIYPSVWKYTHICAEQMHVVIGKVEALGDAVGERDSYLVPVGRLSMLWVTSDAMWKRQYGSSRATIFL